MCTECGCHLKYRDSCTRVWKKEGGEKCWLLIRRLQCEHCGRLHRELPDILAPHKHYETELISGVIDGVVAPEDEDCEDYPCEKTMSRWKAWFNNNRERMEGYLRNAGYHVLDYDGKMLKAPGSLLEKLRNTKNDWLETVLKAVYNFGGRLEPVRC